MAEMTRIQGRRARALAGAAVAAAVLAVLPSVPAGADGDPHAGYTDDVRVDLSDATATPPAGGIVQEPLTDCFDDPIVRGTTLYVPDTSPWTHWFYGTPGDDVIIGTSGPDMIDGGAATT